MSSILGRRGFWGENPLRASKIVALILGCAFIVGGLFVARLGLTFLKEDSGVPKGYYVTSAVEKIDDYNVRFFVEGVEYLIEDVELEGNIALKVAYNPKNPLENKFLKYSDKRGLGYFFMGLGFAGMGGFVICIEWLPSRVSSDDEEY